MFLLVLALLAQTAKAATAEELEWAVWPLPGMVTVVDGKPTGGTTIEALTMLMQHMPDVPIKYSLANRLRQQQRMKSGDQFCSIPMLRRADSDQLGYFIPFMASTPIQAVVRREDLARLPLVNGHLSLDRLLQETDLQVGISTHRTYPPGIASWLEEAVKLGRAESASGTQSGENLLLMVSHHRLDLTFEFPIIIQSIDEQRSLHEPLVSVPLLEYQDLVETGIYCTRDAWGKAMALRLDGAVRAIAAKPDGFLEFYRQRVPAETYQIFAARLRDYYLHRSLLTQDFGPLPATGTLLSSHP